MHVGHPDEVPILKGETQSMEIELKLILPGQGQEEAVVAYLNEHGYTVEKFDPVRNVDTYLDTFDWSLLKNKYALRYRLENDSAMYTLKSVGSIDHGLAKRTENEISLAKPVDVPTVIPVKQIRKLVDEIIFPRKLLEQLQVRTDRDRYRVISPEGAHIELAFDTSSFSLRGLHKARRARKLHEMEAELLKGPVKALSALSRRLSRKFKYSSSTASKLEVAMERLRVTIPSKKPPERLGVRRDDRLDHAVRKILAHQFQWFREQLPGVQRDIDSEFVHQARVATRRMRSALRLFSDAIPDRTGAYFAGEMKWLGGKFGVVRDIDVFLLNLSRFKEKIERLPEKKKRAIENLIEKHRQALQDALCEALKSARYKTLERRFVQFLERPLPSSPRAVLAARIVHEIAPVLITEKLDAVIQQGHTVLAKPKLKEFHRLRIQMKRLRYACEFMAPAYEGALDPFIERTVEIQDCLGELQDTVFTREFIDSLYDEWKGEIVGPDLFFILGEIYQLQAGIAGEQREAFGRIWDSFSSEETPTLLKEIFDRGP
jgi:triphosphatase